MSWETPDRRVTKSVLKVPVLGWTFYVIQISVSQSGSFSSFIALFKDTVYLILYLHTNIDYKESKAAN